MNTCLGELFIRFTASAFGKLPPIYVFSYFPFGFEGRMRDLIVSVPDHCLSFYFVLSALVVVIVSWWLLYSFVISYRLYCHYILKSKSNFIVFITEYFCSCFDLIKIKKSQLVSKTCPNRIQEI